MRQDNGETTIMYQAGQTYEMKTELEMEMAGAWLMMVEQNKLLSNTKKVI